jgi:hypothetical protein
VKTVMVRYKTKDPDAAAENERLIGQVFEQLGRDQPDGLRYQVFKLSDGVSFTHISSFEGAAGDGNPLVKLEAFKNFTAGIKQRCEDAPVSVEMQVVGEFDSLVG